MTGRTRDEEGRVRPGVHIPKTAMDEIERLKEINAELLASLKEMREAMAAAFRVFEYHGSAWEDFEFERKRIKIKDSFGKRADDLITKAEGK